MKTKVRVPSSLKDCKNCGKKFQPKRKGQKYCRDDCRADYYKKHYFGTVEVSKTCPNCKTVFPTTMPKKQKYCSPECRKEAQKKRADGVLAQVDAETSTYYAERYAVLEKDGFKCVLCGRGAKDDVVLTVMEVDGVLRSVCTECKAGKDFIGRSNNAPDGLSGL